MFVIAKNNVFEFVCLSSTNFHNVALSQINGDMYSVLQEQIIL